MTQTVNLIENKIIAEQILDTYRISEKVFLLGCLSSGVTIYKQQVRAHNLACALADSRRRKHLKEIAVVGGGIAGLTCVAALMSLLPKAKITLFERRTDLCPLQQGSDTRWIHPHIYDWPKVGSRAPGAHLPLLDWSEGSAADVANAILTRFAEIWQWSQGQGQSSTKVAPRGRNSADRLNLYIGVTHLKLNSETGRAEWVGIRGDFIDGHVLERETRGENATFDAIVVASGFGLENDTENYGTPSYWRNDTYGQPVLNGAKQTAIISGFGDGAIVDLCRMTIERFRQGRILTDLWGQKLTSVEAILKDAGAPPSNGQKFREVVEDSSEVRSIIDQAVERIRPKIRKDLLVVMHLEGKTYNTSIWQVFDGKSSFLNKLLLLILFQAGAFVPRFDSLEAIKRDYSVSDQRVLLRHGTLAKEHVLSLFNDFDVISSRLDDMQKADNQSSDELWPPGRFPYIPRRPK